MKTHCRNGHERNKENTHIRKNGKIDCLVCKRLSGLRFYKNHREDELKERKVYYYKHHEKCLESRRQYGQNHREEARQYSEEYRKTITGRFSILLNSAQVRKIEVLISLEEYTQIVSSGMCRYCSKSLPKAGSGVDRTDSTIGYVANNCVSCCSACNKIKGCLEMAGFTGARAVELLQGVLSQNEKTTSVPC